MYSIYFIHRIYSTYRISAISSLDRTYTHAIQAQVEAICCCIRNGLLHIIMVTILVQGGLGFLQQPAMNKNLLLAVLHVVGVWAADQNKKEETRKQEKYKERVRQELESLDQLIIDCDGDFLLAILLL